MQQLQALLQQLVVCCELVLGMHVDTGAQVAAVTAEIPVVAKGAAGEQEQLESRLRMELHRILVAIPVDGNKLHSLVAGPCSMAVRVLLAVAKLSPADMLAVHALR